MSLKSSFFCIFLAILFCSCDKKRVFDEYKSVGNTWIKDSIVTFKLPKLDTTKSYNLFLNIRNNNDYAFNNLFLIVSLEQPDGVTKVDTLEYEMTKEDGTLLGEGFTDVKESKLYYKERMKFKPGNYTVHVQHAMRETGKITGVENLDGITELGFRIEKID